MGSASPARAVPILPTEQHSRIGRAHGPFTHTSPHRATGQGTSSHRRACRQLHDRGPARLPKGPEGLAASCVPRGTFRTGADLRHVRTRVPIPPWLESAVVPRGTFAPLQSAGDLSLPALERRSVPRSSYAGRTATRRWPPEALWPITRISTPSPRRAFGQDAGRSCICYEIGRREEAVRRPRARGMAARPGRWGTGASVKVSLASSDTSAACRPTVFEPHRIEQAEEPGGRGRPEFDPVPLWPRPLSSPSGPPTRCTLTIAASRPRRSGRQARRRRGSPRP